MEEGNELAHLPGAMKASDQNPYGEQKSIDRDEADLVRLGKKPVLKVSQVFIQLLKIRPTRLLQRRFRFISLLGFSCTTLITWEGMLM